MLPLCGIKSFSDLEMEVRIDEQISLFYPLFLLSVH